MRGKHQSKKVWLITGAVLVAASVFGVAIYGLMFSRSLLKKPNIILIVVDTLSAKHLSLYGYNRATDGALRQFAQENFYFKNSFSASSYTFTSHMSIFTGLPVATHGLSERWGVKNQPRLSTDIPTLAERLKKLGYANAWFAITSDPHLSLERGFERGFDTFQSDPENIEFNEAKIKWLQAHRNEPKFLFIHTYAVHDPYVPPRPFYGTFDPDYKGPIIAEKRAYTKYYKNLAASKPPSAKMSVFRDAFLSQIDKKNPREIEHIQALYDEEILFVDSQFAKLLQQLKELNLYDDSIIIFTSDHGEAFKEHGELLHTTLHHEVLHVPLIMRVPGIASGSSSVPVQGIDLVPTLLELLGQDIPPLLEGRSLVPLLKSRASLPPPAQTPSQPPSHTRRLYSQIDVGGAISVQDENWKLIRDVNGESKLYDIKTDAFETLDIASEHPKQREDYLYLLERYLIEKNLSTPAQDPLAN